VPVKASRRPWKEVSQGWPDLIGPEEERHVADVDYGP